MNELVKIALSQYGVKEISGSAHNQTIVNYSHEIGYGGIISDETAWCSIFMNWCAMKAGLERSGKLNARSWLGIGQEVSIPELNDVVIFWREKEKGWKGHVAIYINHTEDGKYINCLGGNQSNKVCIQRYNAKRLLGYRRLKKTI